jgi:small subunit ribosomal protein S16
MAVAIRLQRAGAKNRAYFRVVVSDRRKSAKGGFNERIGRYEPVPSPPVFEIDRERYLYWRSVGATISPTLQRLFAQLPAEAEAPAAAAPAASEPKA